jgi:hypothetical protein
LAPELAPDGLKWIDINRDGETWAGAKTPMKSDVSASVGIGRHGAYRFTKPLLYH